MNLQQSFRILLARHWVVVLTLLGSVSVTIAISLLLPAQYKTAAVVVIDFRSHDPSAGTVLPSLALPGPMATQVDIIRSDRVARKVVKSLRLDQNTKFIEDWQQETGGRGSIAAWLGERLQKNLDVRPSRKSSVVAIGFKSTDPVFSAAAANAFAQAYIDTNIELQIEPARQYAAWLENQSRDLRDALSKAQLALAQAQGEARLLQQDVDNAQRAYEAISLRSSQKKQENQSQQTDVTLLSSAIEPTTPVSPKILLNTLLAIVLGALLGVGIALAMELADRRIRSRQDIEQVLCLPVLAELRSK